MLACTRIGALHSGVFSGFSQDALAGRIIDCSSTFVITADEGLARFEKYPAEGEHRQGDRHRCEDPCHDPEGAGGERTGGQVGSANGRDIWYHDAVEKGVLHTTGGYLLCLDDPPVCLRLP